MKKFGFKRLFYFLTGIFLLLVCMISLPSASDSDGFPDILIVYSGDMRGNVEPDGCCYMLGGIARIATVIDNFKKEHPHVMVLDSGDFLWKWDLNINPLKEALHPVETAAMYRAMKMIPYDAIHMADGEILSGAEFLKTFGSDNELPLTSLNVSIPADTNAKPKPYIIRQFDTVRIAVVGLTHPVQVQEKVPAGFMVADPIAVLKNHIREIRDQADIIILVSHLGWENIYLLLEQVADIDIVIAGHDTYPTFESEKTGKTFIVKTARGGGLIGTIRLERDQGTGNIETISSDLMLVEETKIIPLPEFAQIESEYKVQKREVRAAVAVSRKQKKDKQLEKADALFKEAEALFQKQSEDFLKFLQD